MSLSIIKIWKNKDKIYEGIKNRVFKQEHIEEIAAERLKACQDCPNIDRDGSKCEVPGTKPCCKLCGCSLALKTRSLSSACADEDNKRWDAILTEEEDDQLNNQINSDQ
jgi:hypothetical protein